MIDRWSTPVWKSADGTIETLARVPVGQAPFEEYVLRDLLVDKPSLLPVRHLDPVFSSPVCLGTEFPVPGVGRIDALFLSPSGYVTIVETKLWQNPEARREVVAQIIDYAQQVARWTYADLESRFKKCRAAAGTPSSSLFSYVCDLEDDSSDEAEFTDAVTPLQIFLAGRPPPADSGTLPAARQPEHDLVLLSLPTPKRPSLSRSSSRTEAP